MFLQSIAPLLCDNPQASQLLNHLGGAANKYCTVCTGSPSTNVYLVYQYMFLLRLINVTFPAERTRSKTLHCVEMIQLQPTEAGKAAMSKGFGLRDVPNFLLHIPADLFKYVVF